ncbi:hypothetical protein LINPERHAP1_LOCUS29109 [Linum perenne]
MEFTRFRELRSRDWRLKVEHTCREGNHVNDFLASLGYGYSFGSHTIPVSDITLGCYLHYDGMGIAKTRSIFFIND